MLGVNDGDWSVAAGGNSDWKMPLAQSTRSPRLRKFVVSASTAPAEAMISFTVAYVTMSARRNR